MQFLYKPVFIGRRKEAKAIHRFLRDEKQKSFAIVGAKGTGKTFLLDVIERFYYNSETVKTIKLSDTQNVFTKESDRLAFWQNEICKQLAPLSSSLTSPTNWLEFFANLKFFLENNSFSQSTLCFLIDDLHFLQTKAAQSAFNVFKPKMACFTKQVKFIITQPLSALENKGISNNFEQYVSLSAFSLNETLEYLVKVKQFTNCLPQEYQSYYLLSGGQPCLLSYISKQHEFIENANIIGKAYQENQLSFFTSIAKDLKALNAVLSAISEEGATKLSIINKTNLPFKLVSKMLSQLTLAKIIQARKFLFQKKKLQQVYFVSDIATRFFLTGIFHKTTPFNYFQEKAFYDSYYVHLPFIFYNCSKEIFDFPFNDIYQIEEESFSLNGIVQISGCDNHYALFDIRPQIEEHFREMFISKQSKLISSYRKPSFKKSKFSYFIFNEKYSPSEIYIDEDKIVQQISLDKYIEKHINIYAEELNRNRENA